MYVYCMYVYSSFFLFVFFLQPLRISQNHFSPYFPGVLSPLQWHMSGPALIPSPRFLTDISPSCARFLCAAVFDPVKILFPLHRPVWYVFSHYSSFSKRCLEGWIQKDSQSFLLLNFWDTGMACCRKNFFDTPSVFCKFRGDDDELFSHNLWIKYAYWFKALHFCPLFLNFFYEPLIGQAFDLPAVLLTIG